MNKEKFVEKHANKFMEMNNRESYGFETKKYKVFVDRIGTLKALCENCDIRGLCKGTPCREGVVKIIAKEIPNA